MNAAVELTRGCVPVTVIDAQAEAPATPQDLNDVPIASDRNIANAEHPVALATQDHLFIWEDVRQAAAQPRK
jgi:hypothetical protein